ncbi:hypothetical protein EJ066_16550 [Mesorhizobium sp. M9A.F.Ca.ET.002.03.1.2]|uniref:DUF6647 family protein n=1 Tax=Mesorhizobium sp. M9A.F.Ca.ET.002.03.1.2 TaxID=2493668 RepID=UPI000F75A1EF|nr:DUF6647 family protein [Mesorhizobium sp. M9A.F.Ca.ET.002.03.1.2]AZN98644.1 hypothetical protein EJ066_16550 [Mesorhizobium sp. M9A.F.Ca.ET.002.03.1.2]
MSVSIKAIVPWILSAVASAPLAASADESELARPDTRPAVLSRQAVLSGAGLVAERDSEPALLKVIADWLSSEFDLPSVNEPPAIAFASERRMVGLRHRDVPSDRWGGGDAYLDIVGERSDVIAVYDDEARTIYLPEGWSGKTPGEQSVLVHEMVHHIQNVAGMRFACPEEREKTAFEAQERWLGRFGSDLVREFGLDPFTLLVRTNCPY